MEKIYNYLTGICNQSERMAKRNAEKLSKYDDIKEEFETWIDTQDFPQNGIQVEGYSAKQISEMAKFMNGVGVYNFLVSLRDTPQKALQTIKAGFPRRVFK